MQAVCATCCCSVLTRYIQDVGGHRGLNMAAAAIKAQNRAREHLASSAITLPKQGMDCSVGTWGMLSSEHWAGSMSGCGADGADCYVKAAVAIATLLLIPSGVPNCCLS